MKKLLHKILICVISTFTLIACDVHVFPEERHDLVPFQLHLDFNTEMPLYEEILYTRSGDGETMLASFDHDIRYIVNAYRTDNVIKESRIPDTTFVFTKADIHNPDHTVTLELCEGDYTFRVWCDYVDAGTTQDKYYNTSDFSEIILADKENHPGSNDFRDAFRGTTKATVTNPDYYTGSAHDVIDNQARVEMVRPMGKYKFISTDVDDFVFNVTKMMKEKGLLSAELSYEQAYDKVLQSIRLGEYYVLFRYSIFMPCSYNIFTDKPADSWTNVSYTSRMSIEGPNQMMMGYDYIFVNGTKTTIAISLEVYNKDGTMMSSTNPINVPIVRSKLTVVKGEFLTSMANGGVAINPGYDGDDYNIEIF